MSRVNDLRSASTLQPWGESTVKPRVFFCPWSHLHHSARSSTVTVMAPFVVWRTGHPFVTSQFAPKNCVTATQNPVNAMIWGQIDFEFTFCKNDCHTEKSQWTNRKIAVNYSQTQHKLFYSSVSWTTCFGLMCPHQLDQEYKNVYTVLVETEILICYNLCIDHT